MSETVRMETDRSADLLSKYLTFKLDSGEYGCEITKVREIICMMDITTVPRAPNYLKGLINLRGRVLPVIDLRSKLNLNEAGYTDRTCIIVVETIEDSEPNYLGIIVDSVSEVINISKEQIETVDSLESDIDSKYILGIAKIETGVKILLDVDRALSGTIKLSI
jgi:purine-binding chemotaxis protein CheW